MCAGRFGTAVFVVIVAALLATGCIATGCIGRSIAPDQAVTEAERAAAEGRWEDAFAGYRDLVADDPADVAATAGLDEAAGRLVAMVPLSSAETEASLLRWLEAQGRWDEVVRVLDDSMATVPAGWGAMGSPDGPSNERPRRSVYLDAYRIGRYEVTNLQYAAFVEVTGARRPAHWNSGGYPDGTATWPVVGVSWRDAAAYCEWAGGRLPTEAQWERACAGVDGQDYPWGEHWDAARANVTLSPLTSLDAAWPWLTQDARAPAAPGPVGDRTGDVSGLGVCDLAGNAAEWVADWYDPEAYAVLTRINPVGTGPTWNHSVRGGSWLFRHADVDLMASQSRCAFRNASHTGGDPRIGLRCAADAASDDAAIGGRDRARSGALYPLSRPGYEVAASSRGSPR